MNSLLSNSNNQFGNQPSFREFASSITPEGARQQIEAMLQNGQITQQQLDNAKFIANSILNKG